MQNSYEKRSKLHYSEKKVDSVEKLSKKMEYYDKLFNQVIPPQKYIKNASYFLIV